MPEEIEELERQLSEARSRIAELERMNEKLTRPQQCKDDYVPGFIEGALTRRMLVAFKVIREKSISSLEKKPINSCCAEPLVPLVPSILDEPLSPKEAKRFVDTIRDEEKMVIEGSCMYTCAGCKQMVLWMPGGTNATDSWLCDLRAMAMPCCRQPVCGECVLRSIAHDLHEWWHNALQDFLPITLSCPSAECKGGMQVNFPEDLLWWTRNTSSRLKGMRDCLDWLWASLAALQALRLDTDETALRICRELHSSFIHHGKMRCPFASILNGVIKITPEEMEAATAVRTVDITYEDKSYKVPIFTRWFKRKLVSCHGCFRDYQEIAYGSAEEWIESCGGFANGWQWELLWFPAFLSLNCDDGNSIRKCSQSMCNWCCAAWIKYQVTDFGPLHCDYLQCPACPRPLGYYEIRLLTDQETFDK